MKHSLSPAMHNAAFARMGLDCLYLLFPVRPEHVSGAIPGVRALSLVGINVTVPHKEKVIPYLDEVDEEARSIGAVNTIVNREGVLKGYNTDGRGFLRSLEENEIDITGKNVLVIGAGGASKAISYYIARKASKFFLSDIDTDKAERLKKSLLKDPGTTVYAPDSLNIAKGMDVIVNATPLGLKESDPLPIPIDLIDGSQTVIDLIYKETPLLKEAGKKGCRTLDGLGMLLWQGVLASELWTGKKPPVDVMRAALAKAAEDSA